MMIFRRLLQFLILLQLPSLLLAQSNKVLLGNWKSHPIPTAQNAGFHKTDYHFVSLNGDAIVASKLVDSSQSKLPFKFSPSGFKEDMTMKGNKSVIEVRNGYLVGFDNGEFGASLYWFSRNGNQKYQISDHHVKQFYIAHDIIYAIEGIEHMGSDIGSLLLISMIDGQWRVTNSFKLPNDPKAIGIDSKNHVIVITSSAILSINEFAKITILNSFQNWRPQIYCVFQ
ncbi:hypothetical protein SAMN06265348_12146 [Pedobacter westerhofensis]|uniref:Uncharacterized protein n=1 Tax=Pedobacter westerhofensis TaxID=425512 RepID=A0A521FSW7_9SPHI|nr:hypothetical protein [Pedobacter westerhofensis]SMO99278.1 hypothetical protein SAMN06265348_12146 [Pedobacter westerhofensis]